MQQCSLISQYPLSLLWLNGIDWRNGVTYYLRFPNPNQSINVNHVTQCVPSI